MSESNLNLSLDVYSTYLKGSPVRDVQFKLNLEIF